MTLQRAALLTVLAGVVAVALALSGTDPAPANGAAGPPGAPADDPLAARFAATFEAERTGDLARLEALAAGDDAAALAAAEAFLATAGDVAPARRLAALRRVDALRLDEPLARDARRSLDLAIGDAAVAAGRPEVAVAAFDAALPAPDAVAALRTLLRDAPFDLARRLQNANLHQEALDVLAAAGAAAPSIEAPALRALGRNEAALERYRAWTRAAPEDRTARFGLAWIHWRLGDLDAADALFAELGGPDAAYGRGLIANRRGDVRAAADFLLASERGSRLRLAGRILERAGRTAEAIDAYLALAATDSVLADDGAWRAKVLAERLGDDARRDRALDALPEGGYFALLRGGAPDLPTRDDLPDADPPALATAGWLAETGHPDAARRVLAFALRDVRAEAGPWTRAREARFVALGEALTALGEYRIPQRAAATLVGTSDQLRTWRLAYPRAWPDLVEPAAAAAGVDAHLVWAVMRRESAFYPRAVSRSGAQGLMQVMPATWDWLAELQNEAPQDPFAVHANVRYGVHYLGWLHDYFDGDATLLVASYNRGQGYVGRLWESAEVNRDRDELLHAIDAQETREYLQNVTYVRRIYDGLADLEAGRAPADPRPAAAGVETSRSPVGERPTASR